MFQTNKTQPVFHGLPLVSPRPAAHFVARSSVGYPAAPPPGHRPTGRRAAGPRAAMAPPGHRSWVGENTTGKGWKSGDLA